MSNQIAYQQLLELSFCSTEVYHQESFSRFVKQMKQWMAIEYAAILFQNHSAEKKILQDPEWTDCPDYGAIDTFLDTTTYLQVKGNHPLFQPLQLKYSAEGIFHLFRLKHKAIFILYTQTSPLFEKESFTLFQKVLNQVSHSLHQQHFLSTAFILPQKKESHSIASPEGENYKSIVNNISDGIIILNLKSEIIFVNERMCEISGYPLSEILGKHVSDVLLNPEMVMPFLEKVKQTFTGKAATYELDHLHKITQKRWRALVKGRPYYEKGKIAGAIGIISDITEIRNTEKALKESEERYRLLFENGFDGIILFDRYLKKPVGCNNRVLEYFGCTEEEFLNADPLDFSPEIQRNGQPSKEYREKLLNELDEHSMARYEWNHVRSDGTLLDTEVSTFSLPAPNDNIRISILRDISERKAAAANVLKSRASLREAQRLARLGNWEFDLKTRKLEWSEETYRIMGYDLRKPAPDFEVYLKAIHPDDQAKFKIALDETISNGESYELEIRHYTSNGRLIYTLSTGKPLYQADKIVKVFGTIQDVTERKITDHALRETTEKYTDLFENMSDALILINKEGYFVDANKAAQNMLGYPLAELSKLKIKDIVYEEDAQKSGIYLQKLLKNGAYKDYQGRVVTKSGEIKYLQVNSNAILDEAGNFIGSRDIARDITELKNAERKRENLLVELEEVNQELKEFAYVVSHDLKAPLRAISSLSQWLSEDYKDKIDEEGQQQLKLLTQRVSRMHNFIEGILEYSRIGRIKVDKEEVDLNLLIENISQDLQPPDHFTIEVISPLPKIFAERIRMEQLFQNLISNAIKYNDKKKGWVKISYEEQAGFHVFRLQDNGSGIEEKYFDKIFQIFQTLQARDKFESTGIGLTIVKRIVQLYGGEITLHSKLSEGTTFEFSLKK